MAASSEICDARRRNYKDIDEILNFVLGDSDEDIDLEEENYNDDSDWEYEAEHPQPTVTFVADLQFDDIMVDNENNADVVEPTVVEQPIPAGVMIPEQNADTDELLDADDTSVEDYEPLLKRRRRGTICCIKVSVFVLVVVVVVMVYIAVVVEVVWQMIEPCNVIILIGLGKK